MGESRTFPQLLSGRLVLNMFLDNYRFDIDRASELDMRTLWAHEYRNDLALFLDGLDKILLNFNQLQFLGFLRYTNDQVLKKHLRDHSNPMRCMKSLCAQLRALRLIISNP